MAKKPTKKRANKYEEKMQVNADFETVMKAAALHANKRTEKLQEGKKKG